ncbi:MAG: sugar ABC transporter permease [Armatimonadetes bacterium]|nr:sugar ABC transporter permease [Armatimonadota bacterium]
MNRPPLKKQTLDFWAAMLFLAPNLLGFLVFTIGPVLFSLVVSFSNWNLQRTVPFRWVGFENFAELLQSQEFWLYFINTAYLMLGLPVSIAGSLVLAMLLNQRLKGIVVYRTLFYLPSFTSGVALLILWKALYNPDFGPINASLNWLLDTFSINSILTSLGLGAIHPPQWLISTRNILGLPVEEVGLARQQWGLGAKDAILFMGVWTAIGGGNMLLYLAGLSHIPLELYEAASLDGAGRWALFRDVTWPQLAPTTFFIVIMSFIGGLQGGFEQARVMTNGGPAATTTTLAYHIYTKAFQEFQIGYASAVSWMLFLLIFVITLIHWRFGSQHTNY